MKIAVFSDIHDNIWKLELALKKLDEVGAELLLFCGDFCAPFTLDQLANGFGRSIHAIFGNNDGDPFLLSQIAQKHDHVTLHGGFCELSIDSRAVAINHFPEIARPLAESNRYQAVFYGHNHRHKIEKVGNTDLINPGEIMGRFGRSTFIIYDLVQQMTETVAI